MKIIHAELIGGPLAGRSIQVPEGKHFGDVLELTTDRQTAGVMKLESKAHYMLAPAHDPRRKAIVANWINPADRRQYGR